MGNLKPIGGAKFQGVSLKNPNPPGAPPQQRISALSAEWNGVPFWITDEPDQALYKQGVAPFQMAFQHFYLSDRQRKLEKETDAQQHWEALQAVRERFLRRALPSPKALRRWQTGQGGRFPVFA